MTRSPGLPDRTALKRCTIASTSMRNDERACPRYAGKSPACRFRDILARGAIVGFALVFGTLMLLGAGSVVRPLFTPVAIVLAVALFTISRTQYVTFVIWLFFLTPFVRRVVDYQLGYQETSLVVLAPILAASVSLYLLVKKLPLLYSIGFLPFLIILCGLLYAYFVGIINNGSGFRNLRLSALGGAARLRFRHRVRLALLSGLSPGRLPTLPARRHRARDIRRLPVLLPAAVGRLLAAQRPASPRSASLIRR